MNRRHLIVLLALTLLVWWPARGVMQTRSTGPSDLALRAESGPVRVIVRLDVPTIAEDALRDRFAVTAQRASIAAAQGAAIDSITDSLTAVTRFETLPGFAATTDLAGLQALARMPGVAAVEEDHILYRTLIDSTRTIGATALWQQGTEGAGWSVAVLDDGLDLTHAALRQSIVSEACFSTASPAEGLGSLCPGGETTLTGRGASAACTTCSHGTHVAGIAVGREFEILSDRRRISGVARGANLIPINVFTKLPGGGEGSLTSDQIRALEHVLALAGPGNVGSIAAVNMSLGSPSRHYSATCDQDNSLFTQAVNNLRAIGIATIVASGNDSFKSELSFPACVSSVISVGSTDKNDQVSSFSNRSRRLHLLAPGQGIESATLSTGGVPNSFGFSSGTSMAAPHVAGAWALLKSRAPNASVDYLLQVLQQTATNIYERESELTFARINVDRAALVLGGGTPTAPTSVVVNVFGSTVTATWDPPADGSSPTAYHVELLRSVGSVVGIINVGTTRSFTTTLPDGHYLLRVRAITGGSSSTTNEIPLTVGVPANTNAPIAPTDLRAELVGSTLTLSWNLPGGSTVPSSYIIDVGSAPTLSNLGSFDTGSTSTTYVTGPPTAGTYYVRIRARNQFGISTPSNETAIVIAGGAGCTAAPLAPTSLNVSVVGSLVTLNWVQPLTSGPITGYLLEAGTAPALSNVGRFELGPSTIFSGVVGSGTYYVRVRATNACGQSGVSPDAVAIVP